MSHENFWVVSSLTIMKTKVMVIKMLARPTTFWSAAMAMVMAVAVYATRVTVNVKTEKAAAVDFSPERRDGYTHTYL